MHLILIRAHEDAPAGGRCSGKTTLAEAMADGYRCNLDDTTIFVFDEHQTLEMRAGQPSSKTKRRLADPDARSWLMGRLGDRTIMIVVNQVVPDWLMPHAAMVTTIKMLDGRG